MKKLIFSDNEHLTCFLEPVLYSDENTCITGGFNLKVHISELK